MARRVPGPKAGCGVTIAEPVRAAKGDEDLFGRGGEAGSPTDPSVYTET